MAINDIKFQILDWNNYHEKDDIEDEESGQSYVIRLFGRTDDDKSCYVKVVNYTPYFYIEIDDDLRELQIERLLQSVKNRVYPKHFVDGLIEYKKIEKHKMWGFTDNRVFTFLQLIFRDKDSMKAYDRVFKKKLSVPSIRNNREIYYKTYESNIEPMLRCMHIRNLDAVGWVHIEGSNIKKITDDDNSSCCDINITCDWRKLNPIVNRKISPFIIASFDIECMSEDGSFPQPERLTDKIIQIGTTFSRYGESECYFQHIITLDTCSKLKDADELEVYHSEKEVLLAWTKMIKRMNPDIITGWNINGFDFKYMHKRAEKLGILLRFTQLSRMNNEQVILKEKKLSSSALGDNSMYYYDMTGRIVIDMMKVVQRDFKLDCYRLDFVSSTFIKEKVLDIIPDKKTNTSTIITKSYYGVREEQYITIMFDDGIILDKHMNGKKFQIKEFKKDEKNNQIIIVDGIIDGELMKVKKYEVYWCHAKDDIKVNDIFRYQKLTADHRAIIAKYCLQDCALCNKLINKLQIITNNVAMANVCSVPMTYLFYRGQSIKIFSLVLRECRKKNHLFPTLYSKFNDKTKEENKDKDVLELDEQFQNFIEKLNRKENKMFNKYGDPDNDNNEEDTFEGAIVFEPKIGVHYEPVVVLDYGSLYPNSMIYKNLSHECYLLDEKYDNLPNYNYNKITYVTSKLIEEIKKKDKLYGSTIFDEQNQELLKSYKKKNYHIEYSTNKKKNDAVAEFYIEVKDDDTIINQIKIDKYEYRVNKLIDSYREKDSIVILENPGEYKIYSKDKNNNKKDIIAEIILNKQEFRLNKYETSVFAEKKNGKKGIIPEILQYLLDERTMYKDLKDKEKDPFLKSIFDGIQLAYKLTANSLYGQTGASISAICLKQIAASTTATGREMLFFSKSFIENEFTNIVDNALVGDEKKFTKYITEIYKNSPDDKFIGETWKTRQEFFKQVYIKINELLTGFKIKPETIYGDSVTYDTSILLKDPNGKYVIKTIDALGEKWISYKNFKPDEKELTDKQQSICGYQVWTDKGWSNIKRVIRHKTNKKIYEVMTNSGYVKVTSDHSLLLKDGTQIKPKHCVIGTELLHAFPEIEHTDIKIDDMWKCDDNIIRQVMNGSIEDKHEFLNYMLNRRQINNRSGSYLRRKNKILVEGQYKAMQIYFICCSIGYNTTINKSALHNDNGHTDYDDIFDVSFTKTKIKNKYNVTHINDIGTTTDFVYDLETEVGHFHAGVGQLIVKNTDSIFYIPHIIDNTNDVRQKDKKALIMSIQLGIWSSHMINAMLPSVMKQNYEKVLYPFAIVSKKRYVGNLYEFNPDKFKQKSMGIVLKRRDNAPIVKIVCGGIIDQILNKHSSKGAVDLTIDCLKKILSDKYPIDKFIITKTLKGSYKDRTRIAHAILADRIANRDPGNKPESNDRIPYVFIETKTEVKLQGDRIETPEYVKDNNLNIDYLTYIINQIMVPAIQFLELIVDKPQEIFQHYINIEENRKLGKKPINSFLNDSDSVDTEENLNTIDFAPGKSKIIKKKSKTLDTIEDSLSSVNGFLTLDF